MTIFFSTVISERTLSLEEVTTDTLKDDFAWSTLLEDTTDQSWSNCRTQELVTDLTHSGDPSTYLTTPTSTDIIGHQQGSDVLAQTDYNAYTQQQPQLLPSIDSIHNQRSNQAHEPIFHSLDELSPSSGKIGRRVVR